jgi:hypothetical protein
MSLSDCQPYSNFILWLSNHKGQPSLKTQILIHELLNHKGRPCFKTQILFFGYQTTKVSQVSKLKFNFFGYQTTKVSQVLKPKFQFFGYQTTKVSQVLKFKFQFTGFPTTKVSQVSKIKFYPLASNHKGLPNFKFNFDVKTTKVSQPQFQSSAIKPQRLVMFQNQISNHWLSNHKGLPSH